VIKLTKN